jgi:hypothetical protein
MARKILTQSLIRQLAYEYAQTNVDSQILSNNYKISKSSISDALHKAFLDLSISNSILDAIEKKAIEHAISHYPGSGITVKNSYKRVREMREKLIRFETTVSEEDRIKQIEELKSKIRDFNGFCLDEVESYQLSKLEKRVAELTGYDYVS